MRYAFILGRVYTLSFAELLEVLKRNNIEFTILTSSIETVILETTAQIDFEKIQREVGGIIKIVKIIEVIKKRERDSINFALQNYFKPSTLKKDYFKEYSGKKQFGIRVYLLNKNIEWFRNRYKISPGKYHLETSDVSGVSEVFKGEKIAGIVTEGSLGPMYGNFPKIAEIERNFAQLKNIWIKAFTEFSKMLEKDSKVVFCLPAYKKPAGDYIMFPEIDFIFALGYTIEDHFPQA